MREVQLADAAHVAHAVQAPQSVVREVDAVDERRAGNGEARQCGESVVRQVEVVDQLEEPQPARERRQPVVADVEQAQLRHAERQPDPRQSVAREVELSQVADVRERRFAVQLARQLVVGQREVLQRPAQPAQHLIVDARDPVPGGAERTQAEHVVEQPRREAVQRVPVQPQLPQARQVAQRDELVARQPVVAQPEQLEARREPRDAGRRQLVDRVPVQLQRAEARQRRRRQRRQRAMVERVAG